MENLIKTKKLETRFFLQTAQNTQNIQKPGTSYSKNKDRKAVVGLDLLNTTVPIHQFNNSGIGTPANANPYNHTTTKTQTPSNVFKNVNNNLNQTQVINSGEANSGGFSFYPSRLNSHQPTPISSQKHQQVYFVQGKNTNNIGNGTTTTTAGQRHTSHGKRLSNANSSMRQVNNNLNNTQQVMLSGSGFTNLANAAGTSKADSTLRSKWARAIATEANSKTNSPSNSFRNPSKLSNVSIFHFYFTTFGIQQLQTPLNMQQMTIGQANMTQLFTKHPQGATHYGGHFNFQPNSDVNIRVKKHKQKQQYGGQVKNSSVLANKTMDESNTIDNSFNRKTTDKLQHQQQLLQINNNNQTPISLNPHDYLTQINPSKIPVNMNQTQMIINNFFFQPSSPKENNNFFVNHATTQDRNIKTAGAQRRVSSQGMNAATVVNTSATTGGGTTPYDFNKIKKDLDSVRQRHEEAQQQFKNQHVVIVTTEPDNRQKGDENKPTENVQPLTQDPEEVIVFSNKHSMDDYVIGKQIGQGAYATVFIGLHKKSNKKVALKIYEKEKMKEIQRKKSVRREIKLMERLNHPHIAKLYEAIETDDQVILVMEYVSGGSTHGFLKSKPNRRMDEDDARKIFRQVISALQYCHSKCVCHRDIKLENVMLDSKGNVKIIDFGFSTCIPNDKKIKIFCGTPSYMAPEIVAKKEFCGPPADIWACGVLMYAFFCGCFPFRGANDKELYKKIQKGELLVPEHVPSGPRSILLKILQIEPELRPSAAELYCDPWTQGMGNVAGIIPSNESIISAGSSKGSRSFSTKPINNPVNVQQQLNQTQHITSGQHDARYKEQQQKLKQKERVRSSQHYQQRYSQPHPPQPQIIMNNALIPTDQTKAHQKASYNTEAYKAYYNTASSPNESRSPQSRVSTAPHYQQLAVQSPQNSTQNNATQNRLFFNFHPNMTPSQEGEAHQQFYANNLFSKKGGGGGDKDVTGGLNSPIHPSFVPSLLSSFGNSPNTSQAQQNWISGVIGSSEGDVHASGLNSSGVLLNKTASQIHKNPIQKQNNESMASGSNTNNKNNTVVGSSKDLFRKNSS